MCAGTREDGSVIEANDPIWDELAKAAQTAKSNPTAWLDQSRIYGDLRQAKTFSDAFSKWLKVIWQHGCEAALVAYLDEA